MFVSMLHPFPLGILKYWNGNWEKNLRKWHWNMLPIHFKNMLSNVWQSVMRKLHIHGFVWGEIRRKHWFSQIRYGFPVWFSLIHLYPRTGNIRLQMMMIHFETGGYHHSQTNPNRKVEVQPAPLHHEHCAHTVYWCWRYFVCLLYFIGSSLAYMYPNKSPSYVNEHNIQGHARKQYGQGMGGNLSCDAKMFDV